MDGTLVASDGLWDRAMQELARAQGGALPPEFFVESIGLATAEAVALAHRTLGISDEGLDANLGWLHNRVRTLMRRTPPQWFPGARDLVRAVRAAGLGVGLVTSSDRIMVEAGMRAMDRALFDAIVCGDDVASPKPDPEPYLLAAAKLAVTPGDCAVIEDSVIGVTSALAAGCRVVAVASHEGLVAAGGCPTVAGIGQIDLELLSSLPQGSLPNGGSSAVQRG